VEIVQSTNNVRINSLLILWTSHSHSRSIVHPAQAPTSRIEKLLNAFGRKNSILEPATVAKLVVSQLLKAESAQLMLPDRFSILSALWDVVIWVEEGPDYVRKEVLPPCIEYHLSIPSK
jgi:hypothetical protein